MNRSHFHQFIFGALYIVALASLLLIGWAVWTLVQHPYSGVTWSPDDGEIREIDPEGPATEILQPGDHILTIDGVPVHQARFLVDRQIGASIDFVVEREGISQQMTVSLSPPPSDVLWERLIPLVISLSFWLMGLLALFFSVSGRREYLFFFFCQGCSIVLSSGALSGVEDIWAAQVFNLSLWFLGPLTVHFHLHFPEKKQSIIARRCLQIAYLVALAGTLPNFVGNPFALRTMWPGLHRVRLIWFALCALFVVIHLGRVYLKTPNSRARDQIRIIATGTGLGLIPIAGLSLVPDAIFASPLLPYTYSFLFLVLIPLSYGYAIARYRLLNINRYIRRSALDAFIITLLGTTSLASYMGITRAFGLTMEAHPLVTSCLALLSAGAGFSAYPILRKFAAKLIYGAWYDYRSAVQLISHNISLTMDAETIAQIFTQQIREVLLFDFARVILPGEERPMIFVGPDGLTEDHLREGILNEPPFRSLWELGGGIEKSSLHQSPESHLPEVVPQLLNLPQVELLVPLEGQESPIGILIVGEKREGEVISDEDREILEILARQIGLILQNALLIRQLQKQAEETRQLARQILRAREEERKHLARELHDQIIQALIGLNYRLSKRTEGMAALVMGENQTIIGDLREICHELRPPQLDTLGLVPAIRAHIRQVQIQHQLNITFSTEGNEEQDIPEEVAISIYRILQEALRNIHKHAEASQIWVRLHMSSEIIEMTVGDNGVGFESPSHLGTLVNAGHFGLIGMRERAELAGGSLRIRSASTKGTELEVIVPLVDQTVAAISRQK